MDEQARGSRSGSAARDGFQWWRRGAIGGRQRLVRSGPAFMVASRHARRVVELRFPRVTSAMDGGLVGGRDDCSVAPAISPGKMTI